MMFEFCSSFFDNFSPEKTEVERGEYKNERSVIDDHNIIYLLP